MNPQDNNQDVNAQHQNTPSSAPGAGSENIAPQQSASPVDPNSANANAAAPSPESMQPALDQPPHPMAAVAKPKKSMGIIIVIAVVVILAIVGAVLLLG